MKMYEYPSISYKDWVWMLESEASQTVRTSAPLDVHEAGSSGSAWPDVKVVGTHIGHFQATAASSCTVSDAPASCKNSSRAIACVRSIIIKKHSSTATSRWSVIIKSPSCCVVSTANNLDLCTNGFWKFIPLTLEIFYKMNKKMAKFIVQVTVNVSKAMSVANRYSKPVC